MRTVLTDLATVTTVQPATAIYERATFRRRFRAHKWLWPAVLRPVPFNLDKFKSPNSPSHEVV